MVTLHCQDSHSNIAERFLAAQTPSHCCMLSVWPLPQMEILPNQVGFQQG